MFEIKQTEEQPKQCDREHILVFFGKFRVVSVCFETVRFEIFSFWFHETNRNRSSFGLFRFETKFLFVCFEDTLYLGAFPAVVVSGVAAHVDHGVEGGGAAPDAPPRPVHHAVVAVLLRQCVVEPVVPVCTVQGR